jgi:4,5-DOPA dioxygenase extradiol
MTEGQQQSSGGDGAARRRMPAVFVGHGSPMLALNHDELTDGLAAMGARIRRDFGTPRAILAVSAHWYSHGGTRVQTSAKPRQIYDMYGFPQALYDLRYPVAGFPELGRRVLGLPGVSARADDEWGIDHGVWTPLVHMFPDADVPVVELSVDDALAPRQCYEIGRALATLRDEGYLVLGSGNVVHNLFEVQWDNPHGTSAADAFDAAVRARVEARDDEGVIDYAHLPHARYAVPTPDHFLPLLYVLGASAGERPFVFNAVRQQGSVSMTSYAFGLDA